MDKTPRILIVDDERQNIKVLTELLRDDYKVMAAKSGKQALSAVLKDKQPDLILLDIMMPEMDGYEVCRQLKADDRVRHIPIIFVTALDSSDDEAQGFELGAVDYITKPFKPVIVKARIKTHIQLKHKTDLLEHMAWIDGLTEIPNRRSFDAALQNELRRAARSKMTVSLMLLDIDQFKKYNDHYGHAAGDDCLQRVAQAVASASNRASDLTARYGGEEFAAILPGTDAEGARHVAEEIRQAVANLGIPHETSDVAHHVSVSIGVAALAIEPDTTPDDLIKEADRSLYQAKEKGRNRVYVNPLPASGPLHTEEEKWKEPIVS